MKHEVLKLKVNDRVDCFVNHFDEICLDLLAFLVDVVDGDDDAVVDVDLLIFDHDY